MNNGKYSQEIQDRICDLIIEDTYTIREICRIVEISEVTYYGWLKQGIKFFNAIKDAKQEARDQLAALAKNSLRKLIEGSEVVETKEKLRFNTETKQYYTSEKEQTTKTFRPDTTAVIFALTNVDSENFKNRQQQSVEVTNKDALSFEDIEGAMEGLDNEAIKALIQTAAKIKKIAKK